VAACLDGDSLASGGDSAVVEGDVKAGDGEVMSVSSDAFDEASTAAASVHGTQDDAAKLCVAAAVGDFLGGQVTAQSLEQVDYPTAAVQSQGLVGSVSVDGDADPSVWW